MCVVRVVDHQLNAKLADLELGSEKGSPALEDTSDTYDAADILMNWLAPEVLGGEVYTQSADIYSLALVLWEIISDDIPYNNITSNRASQTLKNLVLNYYLYDYN
jgi:hypothetical protein